MTAWEKSPYGSSQVRHNTGTNFSARRHSTNQAIPNGTGKARLSLRSHVLVAPRTRTHERTKKVIVGTSLCYHSWHRYLPAGINDILPGPCVNAGPVGLAPSLPGDLVILGRRRSFRNTDVFVLIRSSIKVCQRYIQSQPCYLPH